jgi:hypothetical protein
MTTKRCPVCNGAKTIAPLGGIHFDCENCQAIGYVTDEVNEADETDSELTKSNTESLTELHLVDKSPNKSKSRRLKMLKYQSKG